jgi:hypothetical protein
VPENSTSPARAAAKASGNVSSVTDHGYGLSAWRSEKSQGNFARMKADADAGDDCKLVPPSSRHRRKTLKHRAAGGERCTGTRPLRISNPKSSHHSVAGQLLGALFRGVHSCSKEACDPKTIVASL